MTNSTALSVCQTWLVLQNALKSLTRPAKVRHVPPNTEEGFKKNWLLNLKLGAVPRRGGPLCDNGTNTVAQAAAVVVMTKHCTLI